MSYDLELVPARDEDAPPAEWLPPQEWRRPTGRSNDTGLFVDWQDFWTRDRRESDWLLDDIWARGRGHAVYASQKTGKSEFTLWCCLQALKQPNTIVAYFDYEMGEDDLYDRLVEFGYDATSDLSRLRYALLPSMAPLDTIDGGYELHKLIDSLIGEFPGFDIVVIIDTMGRAVIGEENSNDTVRDFYRHTGLGLKQRGVTWVRLDHAGRDVSKGQRGASAKGEDVDVVWRIARTDDGAQLIRDAARMSWVPDKVSFRRVSDPDLRYVRVAHLWPAGTAELAALLDKLEVPLESGEKPAGKALRDAGHKAEQRIVRAAVKWRRHVAEEAR